MIIGKNSRYSDNPEHSDAHNSKMINSIWIAIIAKFVSDLYLRMLMPKSMDNKRFLNMFCPKSLDAVVSQVTGVLLNVSSGLVL